ncbi:MAG: Ig-like domain-containing protein [Methanophagales archaeon]|nr:Ig-like domain-containing protein [Methanophagales archaeon]
MTEKEREKIKAKAKVEKRREEVISSFVVISIVLSVLAVSVAPVSAQQFNGIIVSAVPTSIPADGSSTSTIIATLSQDGVPVGRAYIGVIFECPECESKGAALSSSFDSTDGEGKAYTTLRAGDLSGLVTINAKTLYTPTTPVASGTTQVTLTEPGPDTTPPAQITNLATSTPTNSTIDLTWTAPGDDGNTGTATTYDIRYLEGTTPIADANWASATQCTGEPAPQVAGSSETFTVTGLSPSTTYYFALKTADEVPNESPLSNVESGTTIPLVLTTITISPPSVTLKVNATQQFTATAYDQYSEEMSGVTFAWSVSNGTVGTVTGAGLFEAKAVGGTLVNATADSVTESAEVNVIINITDYYRTYEDGDVSTVTDTEILKAEDDWVGNVIPPGFDRWLSDTEILTLEDEWMAT